MSPSPQDIPLPVSPVAGVKRPAPSLLPAFEPFFSSPQLPRPNKRFAHASPSKANHTRERSYPTPIPSSSTIVASSSPPKGPSTRRAGLTRTLSTVSERAPLSVVPTLDLSEHGEPTLMGRSSNSSHYQLSTNKLISRIHVRATYLPADPPAKKKVQVECVGWNGVRVHCTGRTHDLERGQVFTSEIEGADIMVDVQDARVLLSWPKHESSVVTPTDSENSWGSLDNTPTRSAAAAAAAARNRAPSTSPLRHQRLQSPVSPSPTVQAAHAQPSSYFESDPPVPVPVQVYEDEPEDEDVEGSQKDTQSTQFASQPLGTVLQESQTCDFESDNDEENDPIISSFSGPYGANLTANMENFSTRASPRRQPLDELPEESVSPQRRLPAGLSPKLRRRNEDQDVSSSFGASFHKREEIDSITSHVVGQLAYSRLSSTPLSTLMQNLPNHHKVDLDSDLLISLLEGSPCIGEVTREGKDAAGKRLESEYYYIPEGDADESRREMVEAAGLGGRGLRNCRKSHKVCLNIWSNLAPETAAFLAHNG